MDAYLKPGMGPVLFALFKSDAVPMADLVRRTGLVPSTISRTVKAMTRTGVVSARRHSKDARSVIVRLTPLGRSLEARCNQMADEIDQILVRGLSKAKVTGTGVRPGAGDQEPERSVI